MSANVAGIVQKGETAGLITFENGSKPAWTPNFEQARALLKVGAPIPPDWTVTEGDYGPKAMPPRPKGGGGATAWRNTREGAEYENANRIRWQEYEQERMDRRTALMQAVAANTGITTELAEKFYQWLRKSAGASGGRGSAAPGATRPSAAAHVPADHTSGEEPSRQTLAHGEGTSGSKGSSPGPSRDKHKPGCPKTHVSDLKPDETTPMPKGKLRCTDCGAVLDESEVA